MSETRSAPRAGRAVDLGQPEDWRPIETVDPITFACAPGPLRRVLTTDELLIAYDAHGRPHAIGAHCPHRELPLAVYARPGSRPGTIVCTAHRCVFDVASGACVASELREAVPPLRSYPIVPGARGWTAQVEDDER